MEKLCPHKLREAGASLASSRACSFLSPGKEGSGSAAVLCKRSRCTGNVF